MKEIWKGFLGAIGGFLGLALCTWLAKYIGLIPVWVIRFCVRLIPQEKEAGTLSHVLYYIGIPLFFVPLLYVLWRENRYVGGVKVFL